MLPLPHTFPPVTKGLFYLVHYVWLSTKRKCFSNTGLALAGVAQWIEHRPPNHNVARLISSQGTNPGCGPGPQLGACKRQPVDVCLAH